MDGDDLQRFKKICGMLGSSHVGERAAAGAKATEFLTRAGLTWQSVGVNGAMSSSLMEKMELHSWQASAKLANARANQLADENIRLKREVDRLKGMWPQGAPTAPVINDDKALRRKIAEACEACARGDATMSAKSLNFFKRMMLAEDWSIFDRAAVERALKWVKYV